MMKDSPLSLQCTQSSVSGEPTIPYSLLRKAGRLFFPSIDGTLDTVGVEALAVTLLV